MLLCRANGSCHPGHRDHDASLASGLRTLVQRMLDYVPYVGCRRHTVIKAVLSIIVWCAISVLALFSGTGQE